MDTPFWGTFGQPARARGVVLGSLHAPGRSLSPLELFGAACANARARAGCLKQLLLLPQEPSKLHTFSFYSRFYLQNTISLLGECPLLAECPPKNGPGHI